MGEHSCPTNTMDTRVHPLLAALHDNESRRPMLDAPHLHARPSGVATSPQHVAASSLPFRAASTPPGDFYASSVMRPTAGAAGAPTSAYLPPAGGGVGGGGVGGGGGDPT